MTMRILLMIPCFNEEKSICRLLEEIHNLNEKFDTIVIDDGSTDKTYFMAKKYSHCIKLPVNLGIGASVQAGIKYALNNDYDICIQVDGDGQHPPYEIQKLIDKYVSESVNLVIGSRFVSGNNYKSSKTRRLGIKIISAVIMLLYSKKITDPTSGLRLMDKEVIRLFYDNYPYDYPEPISCAVVFEEGLIIKEVAVNMRDREHGSSSIMGLKTIAYMTRVVGYLLLTRIGRYV